jgi:hypothetical protein
MKYSCIGRQTRDGRAQATRLHPQPHRHPPADRQSDAGSPTSGYARSCLRLGCCATQPPALATGKGKAPVIIQGFDDLIALAAGHRDLAIACPRTGRGWCVAMTAVSRSAWKTPPRHLANELTRKLSMDQPSVERHRVCEEVNRRSSRNKTHEPSSRRACADPGASRADAVSRRAKS